MRAVHGAEIPVPQTASMMVSPRRTLSPFASLLDEITGLIDAPSVCIHFLHKVVASRFHQEESERWSNTSDARAIVGEEVTIRLSFVPFVRPVQREDR